MTEPVIKCEKCGYPLRSANGDHCCHNMECERYLVPVNVTYTAIEPEAGERPE